MPAHLPPRTRGPAPLQLVPSPSSAVLLATLVLSAACQEDAARALAPSARLLTASAATAPSAPRTPRAWARPNGAFVRWSTPASDGASAVRTYRVSVERFNNDRAVFWQDVPATDTSVVITGLRTGVYWRFRVLALNAVGASPLSVHSNGIIPTAGAAVPAAPTNVTATAGDAQATVTWTAPETTTSTGPLVSHRVTVQPGGRELVVAAPATSTTVTGLTNGTAYTFVVAATTANGTGVNSTPSAAVTPQAPVVTPPVSARWLMGYYVGYQRALYPENEVDFGILTHILVGRIRPAADGSVITNFDVDDVQGPAMARTLATRAHAAGKKALLMLGGAGEHAAFQSAASSANRARFAANLIRVMDALGYDGIDVDWEPILLVDRAPLVALLEELRRLRPGILLTVPVQWVNVNLASREIDPWYAELAARVDRMNIMSYDMAGPWGWESWHHSALTDHAGLRPSSVSSSAETYLRVGVPRAKLGIGLGFYGSCWRNVTGPRQTVGGNVTLGNSDNSMSYANIMAQYYVAANRVWDAAAQVPYLSFTTPRGPQQCNFVSYEDEQSVAAKGAYVKAQGLGGAIVWTINQGRLPTANAAGTRDPLLRAAYTSMVP